MTRIGASIVVAAAIGCVVAAASPRKEIVPPGGTSGPSAQTDGKAWRSLFDGTSLDAWRGYKTQTVPDGWRITDRTLEKDTRVQDLVSKDEFGDFELQIEWKIGKGGNSGILYRVTEDQDVSWKTAPEYQIIDNAYKEPLKPGQLAGANYDLNPPSRDATKPIGSSLTRTGSDHVSPSSEWPTNTSRWSRPRSAPRVTRPERSR